MHIRAVWFIVEGIIFIYIIVWGVYVWVCVVVGVGMCVVVMRGWMAKVFDREMAQMAGVMCGIEDERASERAFRVDGIVWL